MVEHTDAEGAVVTEESDVEEADMPITGRRLAVAIGGGAAGIVAMFPLLVGVPWVLNLFRVEPIRSFAQIGAFVSLEPTVTLGIVFFVGGGILVLPVLFLVVGAFLPPVTPRFARGVTFATMFWTGFLFEFWPGGGLFPVGVFVVVSLLAHWVYGTVLGLVLDRLTGLPQHYV